MSRKQSMESHKINLDFLNKRIEKLQEILSEKNTTFNTIFIDDPIQHLDGINLLSFIDVLRTITTDFGRQIVISTHNEQFYKLLKVKMDERYYPSKFIELTSTGTIKEG